MLPTSHEADAKSWTGARDPAMDSGTEPNRIESNIDKYDIKRDKRRKKLGRNGACPLSTAETARLQRSAFFFELFSSAD